MDTPLTAEWDERQARLGLLFAGGLLVLGGLAALAWLLWIPGDPKNSLIFGLSAPRLAILLLPLLVTLAVLWFVLSRMRQPGMAARILNGLLAFPLRMQLAALAGLGLAGLGWLGVFWPDGRLGISAAYLERLRPLLAWLLWVGLVILVTMSWVGWRRYRVELRLRSLFLAGGFAWGACLLFWGVVARTHLGVWPGTPFWNKVSVPLLAVQVAAAWAIALLVLLLTTRWEKRAGMGLDVVLAFLFWLAAALLWNQAALPSSHFNTGIYPPNNTVYPLSDAAVYDRSAQVLLIGQTLKSATDKIMYITLLTLLNGLAGSNYALVLLLQVSLFAVLPALLYLLGRMLHSRPAGVMLGLLFIFKELNAIASTDLIQVSHVKMMMSEVPTEIGIVLFAVLLVAWLRNPDRRAWALLAAGGVLGLAGFTRLSSLFVLPPALLLVFLTQKTRRWRSVLMLVGMLVITMSPWMARSVSTSGTPFKPFINKLRGVIYKVRYSTYLNAPAPVLSPDSDLQPAQGQKSSGSQDQKGTVQLGRSIVSHYAHNLIGSLFILPPVWLHNDLLTTIHLPYWDLQWDGALPQGGAAGLALVLGIVGLGIGAAWARRRWLGLLPLSILLAYHLATAIALTSGGRYIVPVDFVIPFYFVLGIMEISLWIVVALGLASYPAVPDPAPVRSRAAAAWKVRQLLPLALVFLAIGGLPVLLENAYPQRYTSMTNAQALALLEQRGLPDLARQAASLSVQPEGRIWIGRALYPRVMPVGAHDSPSKNSVLGERDYPRLIFSLLGPHSSQVIMPMTDSPQPFAHAQDVLVIGCAGHDGTDALAVVVLGDPPQTILRSPRSQWTCPLPQPICGNGVCQ